MCPHTSDTALRRLLVPPKDKVELAGELVYHRPCINCGAKYVGETGRLLKTRLVEYRKDVANTNNEKYTRSWGKRVMSNEGTYELPCVRCHLSLVLKKWMSDGSSNAKSRLCHYTGIGIT